MSLASLFTVGGAAAKMGGGILSGITGYQAERENAEALRQAGVRTRLAGEDAALRQIARGRSVAATATARAAKSGVNVGSGSPLQVAMASISNAEKDAMAERQKAALQGWYYDAESGVARRRGTSMLTGKLMDATSAALYGIGNLGIKTGPLTQTWAERTNPYWGAAGR